jgi:hypothetical protein
LLLRDLCLRKDGLRFRCAAFYRGFLTPVFAAGPLFASTLLRFLLRCLPDAEDDPSFCCGPFSARKTTWISTLPPAVRSTAPEEKRPLLVNHEQATMSQSASALFPCLRSANLPEKQP